MFKKGSFVNYSTTGVCKISEIITQTVSGQERQYFCLLPVGKESNKILVPVDNEKLFAKMRSIPEKEVLEELFAHAQELCAPWQENDIKRSELFKDVIEVGKNEELLGIIGCIVKKRTELKVLSKNLKIADNNALKTAERILASTVSVVYSITFDEAVKKLEGLFDS